MDNINNYWMLKTAMDKAYERFDKNPTQHNSDMYGIALHEFQDFCVEVVGQIVVLCPELIRDLKL